MPSNARFWRNVVLVALAHVALIAGLIRWSLAAKAPPEPENIMWLGAAADVAAAQPENEPTPATTPLVEPEPSKNDKTEEEKSATTIAPQARSEIELPSPTPKPTPRPTPTPKPTETPKPKPKRTPRSTARPTPKKTLPAKTSHKASPKPKRASKKPSKKSEKTEEKALTNKGHQGAAVSSPPSSSTEKAGTARGGNNASEFAWYGDMLHDRFYRAWIQPTTNITPGTKISTLVRIRIEKDGHVSKFEIIKPSGNPLVNESVRVIAKQVTQVDAPPKGLIKGDHYDVKINFELNTTN
jgi:colicin import membrane protein